MFKFWKEGLTHVRDKYFRKIGFYLKCSIFGFTPLSYFFTKHFLNNHPIKPELFKYIEQVKPDLVIIPSSAVDEIAIDLLRLSKRYHFKTLFLIDNWDNLSSKSVFPIKPDYMAVWGEQSVEHAVQIHGMDKSNVTTIGTPRFEVYETAIKQLKQGNPIPSPYPGFDYLLFTGCSIEFSEVEALKELDTLLIEINAERQRPLKIIYRPHPWRLPRLDKDNFEGFKEAQLQHVLLDEAVKECYAKQQMFSYMPNLNYFPALLSNAKGVIGPLTTLLIEAALFEKPIIALAYDDKRHYTSPDKALKYYRHFEGVDKLEGWQVSRSMAQMVEQTRTLINQLDKNQTVFDTALAQQQLQYYLYRDEHSYAQRLAKLVDNIAAAM